MRIFGVLALAALAAPLSAQQAPGKATYDKWCAGCHGETGEGDGPAAAYLLPRPRDFTQAQYQIRTTESGAIPTDADILYIIDEGMPGTSMPGWKDLLTSQERRDLVTYLKSLSPFFKSQPAPTALSFGKAPSADDEAIAEGKKLYEEIECWKCHGRAGRGDGPSAREQDDEKGFPIRPADLTENWYFNGGGSVEEIYRRLRTGLDGTPMPSFSDLLASNIITDRQLWNIAHYVRSLSPAEPPRIGEVVRARRVENGLPSSPDDSAWADVEESYIPLVGQIIVKPRWFAPTVDGVYVKALHDGNEVALRVRWHDPSRSPDPAWSPWQTLVQQTMEPKEGDAAGAGGQPDMLVVQFPRTVPAGAQRPYFLMGTSRDPVYLWQWRSQPGSAIEAAGRGFGRIEPLAGASAVTASAVFDQGEWRVVFRRALATPDTAGRIQFPSSQTVPMAFFAWDGNNGEEGTRGAVSSWYYIYLDQPTPTTVYAAPLVATLLTAALGLMVVVRAQRREKSETEEARTNPEEGGRHNG